MKGGNFMKRFYIAAVCSIFSTVCIAMLSILQTKETLVLQYMSSKTYTTTCGILAFLIVSAVILLVVQIFKMNPKK